MKFFNRALLIVFCLGPFSECVHAAPFVHPSFNPRLNTGAQVTALLLTEDGKILLAGNLLNEANEPGVLRLNAKGALDESFQPLPANGMVESLRPGSDGTFYAGGRFSQFDGLATHGIARFHQDGILDAGFQVPSPTRGAVRTLGFTDGRLLAAGTFSQLGGIPAMHLAQVGADGRPITTFLPPFQRSMAIEAGLECMAVQPNGKILVGGTFNTASGPRQLIRLNADGSLDDSFDGDHGPILYPSSIIVREDGSILVAGLASADNSGFVRRLMANGDVDSNFEAPSFHGMVHDLCVDAEGRIVVAGKPEGEPSHGAVRLQPDGALDSSWNVTSDRPVLLLKIDGQNRLLAGGPFTKIQGVSRNGLALLAERSQPAFHGASTHENGTFRAQLQAEPGRSYVVESSADLSNWNIVSTNTATGAGLEIIDAEAEQQPKRFFRARLLGQ